MTNIINKTEPLYRAYPYLPKRIVTVLGLFGMKYPGLASDVTEIRLRLGGALSLSVSGKNVTPDETGSLAGGHTVCTSADIDETADLLCGSSFHSHKAELESGYVSSGGAVRAGISTYGLPDGSVWGIDGVCIRIPRDFPGCSLPLLGLTGVRPMLICSPPGVGKTTLLRDIAYQLSDRYGLRTVVCDPKYELLPDKRPLLCDYICGKEKASAIECATRCLSPQAIICDELGGDAEARAVLTAQSGGVPLIATAHADRMESMLRRPNLKLLYDSGVFEKYVFLHRDGTAFSFDIKDGAA
jgi:stage III sporulation protein AA